MLGAAEFGADFQRVRVRACLEDGGLRRLVDRFVSGGQLAWTDPASAWAWRVLQSGGTSVIALETEAHRLSAEDPARAGAQAICSAPDYRAHDWVRGQVIEWARRQTFQAAFEDARQAWNAGRHTEAYDAMQRKMHEILAIKLDAADRGWFFEELEERQERRARVAAGLDYWSTGIDQLDIAMNGGVHYGDLHVPVAYSGIGKTFYCVQMGFVCARSRGRALHFVLEGGRAKTEDRYEARFTDLTYREVRTGDLTPESLRRLHHEYAVLRHNLVLRGYADSAAWRITIEDIQAELDTLRTDFGWVPDEVIVDYGDLIHAPGNDDRERQKAGFRQLKALAERHSFRGHRGYAVVAPSQAVRPDRGADEREHVLRPRDIADCYEKVRVADSIVTINRTLHELEHKRARVHLGKYRDDEDGGTWRIQTDYAHGAFALMGVPEPPPLLPPPPPGKKPPAPPSGP